MTEDKRDLWERFPGSKLDKKILKKRMRKVEGASVRHAHKFLIKRWDNVRNVQKNVIIWVLALGLLIAATGIQLIWDQQNYQTYAAASDGTYAEAVVGPVDTLNPLFAKSSAEQSASRLLFSRLLNYDTTGHLNYDLASDIKISDNKTTYTVTIKPNAKWSDGEKLTAKDIIFTVGLMKDPTTRATETGWDDITTKLIDDRTVAFILRSTFAPFEHALTFPIVPEHILGKTTPANIRENEYSNNPVSSGPFKLNFVQDTETKSGHEVVYMTRNDSYYRGSAKLARFQLHVYDTVDKMIKALSNSEVTAAAGILFTDIGKINTKKYEVISKPVQSGMYAILNTRSALLKDAKLRRALQLGTDTSAILKKLPNGTPALWLPLTTNQFSGYVPSAPKYNIKAAKKLLEKDGWKLGSDNVRKKKETQLKLSIITIKNSEHEFVLDILVDQWRSLGVAVETKVIDLDDATQGYVQNILQPRNFDILLYQLNIGADPDVYAYWHSSQATAQGLNFSNYSNAVSDVALSSARDRLEPDVRNAKYATFAKQWLSDVPAIGLYQPTMQYVVSKKARAFDKSDSLVSPVDRYVDVLDWSVGEKNVFKTP